MANEEHLQFLNAEVKTWNQWRKDNLDEVPDLSGTDLRNADLRNADLHYADFSRADLSAADLSGADLRGAILKGADLHGAHLSGAHLRNADLRNTDLNGAHLSGADLHDADLHGADLRNADLRNADLSGADLHGAHLSGADLGDADLREANLKNADLTRSRFIGCNLRDAVVENARVTDIDVQRLRGLPKPPEQLRVQPNDEFDEVLLTGFEAKEFFNLPALVEVYITRELNQQELGCYHFHLGEMYHEGVATDVYFIGHRHENSGSVLRFQAKSYDAIYQVLPDLLAPFRMAGAVDWKQTIQAIPAEDRGEAITALAVLEPRTPVVEWRFARRMAEIFDGYRNAKVNRISEWGSRRIHIEIIENPDEVQRLLHRILPEPWDTQQRLYIEAGGGPPTINVIGRGNMGEQHFHGGHYQGCSFGDRNSLTNYFGVVDNLATTEEDIKQKLKEARAAIERENISDDDKSDVVDDLNKLTAELAKPEKNTARVQRFLSHIKEVAPTAASILASAASLAKLLGVG
jgi:hypothetical protein